MKTEYLILIGVAVVAIAAALLKPKSKGTFGAKQIATAHEQKMFWRLIEAFPPPEFIVLTQVSFGAMLTAKAGANRNSFSQKRADFVVLTKGFRTIAVIELDDASHKGREDHDAKRDQMLESAGYKTLRYRQIPEAIKVREDVMTAPVHESKAPTRGTSQRQSKKPQGEPASHER